MSADVEYIEKVYNYYSRFYDQIFGKIVESGREMAPGLLELSPQSQLLEVGIGTGLSIPTLPKNVEITGIDLSEKMLQRARVRIKSLGLENTKLLKMVIFPMTPSIESWLPTLFPPCPIPCGSFWR